MLAFAKKFMKIDLSKSIFLIEPHLVLKHLSYINTPENHNYKLLHALILATLRYIDCTFSTQ